MKLLPIIKFAALALATQAYTLTAVAVPRAQCFGFEKLDSWNRQLGQEILMKTLDGEGLYTFAGIKPMTSGIHREKLRYPLLKNSEEPTISDQDFDALLKRIDQYDTVLNLMQCGNDLKAGLEIFDYIDNATKEHVFTLEVFIARASLVEKAIQENQELFTRVGMSNSRELFESSDLKDPTIPLMQRIFQIESLDRFSVFGHLFGYPKFAVQFFTQRMGANDGVAPPKDRYFFSYPTFEVPSGSIPDQKEDQQALTFAIPRDRLPPHRKILDQFRKETVKALGNYIYFRHKHFGGKTELSLTGEPTKVYFEKSLEGLNLIREMARQGSDYDISAIQKSLKKNL